LFGHLPQHLLKQTVSFITELRQKNIITLVKIAFKRCEDTVQYSIYPRGQYDGTGNVEYKSAFTFTKCERDHSGRLKPNQTVAEYIGKIRGNDLILTVKESAIHGYSFRLPLYKRH
jgi:hypothetical protein